MSTKTPTTACQDTHTPTLLDDIFSVSNMERFYSYARFLGLRGFDVEDVVHDAICSLLSSKVSFQSVGAAIVMILQCIRWRRIDVARRAGHHDLVLDLVENNEDEDFPVAPSMKLGVYRPTELLSECQLEIHARDDIIRHLYLCLAFGLTKRQALEMLPMVFIDLNGSVAFTVYGRSTVENCWDNEPYSFRELCDLVRVRSERVVAVSAFGSYHPSVVYAPGQRM
jgi:hypothetical protein